MHRNHFYIFMMLIAVLCTSIFFYLNYKDSWHKSLAAIQEQPESQSAVMFPAPEQTRYQMQIYLDVETRTLYGTTILTTKNTSAQAMREMWFTVYPNCFRNSQTTPAPPEAYYAGFNEGWLEFDSFKVNDMPAEISGQGASLRVKPSTMLLPDSDIKIEMSWKVLIPRLEYRFGSSNTIYMLGNFYPTLNVLSKDGWHNAYNSSFGDPFCFHSADYLVTLNIPSGYNYVSGGKTIDAQAEDNGREIYIIEAENARDFCLLVMYDYTEIEQKSKNTTVKCYFPRNHTQTAEYILNQSVQILDYYACKFGSYPYTEFKTVIVPMQGFHGMEYSGLIFLQDEMLQSNSQKQRSQFVLAHEIAHQWWYGMVGNDQLQEPWLDEGLANWSAYQFLHEMQGQALPVAAKRIKHVNLGKGLAQMHSQQDYYLTAYNGGEAFWFELEEQLGHDGVIRVLRHYLADYRYKIATTQDLINIIKYESDENMDDFLNQWFAED